MQAETLTHYLAQLLVTRLVQKEMLSMDSAMFESTHLRVPILHALDAAWQAVIIVRTSILPVQSVASSPAFCGIQKLCAAFEISSIQIFLPCSTDRFCLCAH